MPSYSTPTLHVLGKTDAVVVEERSRQLIEVSENSRVEEHNGGDCISFSVLMLRSRLIIFALGHFVPSQSSWRKLFANYMSDPSHPSPSTIVVSPEPEANSESSLHE